VAVMLVMAPATAFATARAPSGPPLSPAGNGAGGGAVQSQRLAAGDPPVGGAVQSQPFVGGDPLVDNGLGSPTCQGQANGLSVQAQSNCRTSGFAPAPAPTPDYAFDIHFGGGGLFNLLEPMELFQQYLLAPVWMGLVWIEHALLAMIEWSYTIDLLPSTAANGLGRGLRATQAAFTQPWLVFALAMMAVLVAYHGLLRRRVAATIGEVLMVAAMMIGGLWVIADPVGTVGALGAWTNQASLGALGALAQGSPDGGMRTLADGMGEVFADGVQAPWCYLEFGAVAWCREPAQLDPRLRAAGLRLAAKEQSLACKAGGGSASSCTPAEGGQAQAYSHSAELLRAARSNGELFLALPANGPARNSVGSGLLAALCGGGEVGGCTGPTAPQAEFRGGAATEPRAAGLLLILLGAAGMVLVLGLLALRLLGAALGSLLYLLLAPAAVLAPAFGDGGREAFRLWATGLAGAVMAKLLYSILLGAALAAERILLGLPGIGWWPQWLLVCAVWWTIYRHRHRLLGAPEWRYRDLAQQWRRERRLQA
jgi:hypothetical protein